MTELKVFIRQLIAHDDSDPGPGKGEFEVTLGVAGGPPGLPGPQQAGLRWHGSVAGGRTYEVAEWIGPVTAGADTGWIAVAGGGLERDPVVDDQVRGGLAMLGPEHRFGRGAWWRTANGRHFDLVFCVTLAGETEAACPAWSGELLDAPSPAEPTEAEYRAILLPGFDERAPEPKGVAGAQAPVGIPQPSRLVPEPGA